MRISRSLAPVVAILFSMCVAGQSDAQTIPFWAFGTDGYYHPEPDLSGGPYGGWGLGFPLGFHLNSGNLAVTPTNPPFEFTWTTTEPQISIGFLGSILFDADGEVVLDPVLDGNGNPTGVFTAEWDADFHVVGGTGIFYFVKPADEPLKVHAVNDPFTLDDPEWNFSWTLVGKIRLF